MTRALEKPSIIAARELTAALVRRHGVKRGLHLAGEQMGCSERWARSIHYREAHHVSDALGARAVAARRAEAVARIAALRAELALLERRLADGR